MKNESTPSVLIAEDDALLNASTADQLQRLGYRIAGQAYDGSQAVTLAVQYHPSVVLMDLQMINPESGREDPEAGFKAIRALQERAPTVVLLLTAHESPDLVRQAGESGVSGYLVKPVGDQELDRAIAIASARFDDQKALRRLNEELRCRNAELQVAMDNIKTLSGLIPICAHCKKIRNDQGYWQRVEIYIQQHAPVTFSHGICPECFKQYYPDNFP